MKSILKILLKNRLIHLILIDLSIILWIVWFESRIQYEPPLDYTDLEAMKLPLIEEEYNMMIIGIFINIIVLINEYFKIRNRKILKYDLIVMFVYSFLISICMLLGWFYISARTQCGVIDESNTLFRLPIWIFGKKTISNFITVTSLYLSICIIHICVCTIYMYKCVENFKGENVNQEITGDV